MSDLVEFLTARLDDTERALIEYREHRKRGPHLNYEDQDWKDYDEYDSCSRCISTAQATPYSDVAFGLADVASKRRIIAEHAAVHGVSDAGPICSSCGEVGNLGSEEAVVEWPCRTLHLLALPYAGHPEYLPEWAPDE